MTDREKLIELLLSGEKTVQCDYSPEVNCDGAECAFCERVEIADRLIANGVTFAKDIEARVYDKEEVYTNCTVQVLTNTVTGDVSVGWWRNDKPPMEE